MLPLHLCEKKHDLHQEIKIGRRYKNKRSIYTIITLTKVPTTRTLKLVVKRPNVVVAQNMSFELCLLMSVIVPLFTWNDPI